MKSQQRKQQFWITCLVVLFILGPIAFSIAQENPQSEKRYVRLQFIEVARKSLADSILVQLQQGISFPKLARMYSIHPTASKGGEKGWIEIDSLKNDLKTIIENIPTGKSSSIVREGEKYFIYFKTDELSESEYIKWQQKSSELDNLISYITGLIDERKFESASLKIDSALTNLQQIENHEAYVSLLDAKGEILIKTGKYNEAISFYKNLRDLANIEGDSINIMLSSANLGYAYRLLAKHAQSIDIYTEALEISRKKEQKKIEAIILQNIGASYGSIDEHEKSIAYGDSALSIFVQLRDSANIEITSGNIGIAMVFLGRYDQGISSLRKAIEISSLMDNLQNTQRWLSYLGRSFQEKGDYSQAIAYYDSARIISRKLSDEKSECIYTGEIGISHHKIHKFDEAIYELLQAIVCSSKINDSKSLKICLTYLMDSYFETEEYEKILATIPVFTQIGGLSLTDIENIDMLNRMGIANFELKKYDEALYYYRQSLKIAHQYNYQQLISYALLNIGSLLLDKGDIEQALVCVDSSLTIAIKLNDDKQKAKCFNSLGNINLMLSNYSTALEYYSESLSLCRYLKDEVGEIGAQMGIGNVYYLLGRFEDARKIYDDVALQAEVMNNLKLHIFALSNLGICYASEGRLIEALVFFSRALAIVQTSAKHKILKSNILLRKGFISYCLNQYEQAITELDSAIFIMRELDELRDVDSGWDLISRSYMGLGKYQKAVAYSDSAIVLSTETNDVENLWREFHQKAKILMKMPNRNSSEILGLFENAITFLEKSSYTVVEDINKLAFFESKGREQLFDDYITLLVKNLNIKESIHALEIAEKARARSFMELIARRFHGNVVEQKKDLLSPANFQQIQQTAQRFDANILEYFISDSNLVIWLIKPDSRFFIASVPINTVAFDSLLDMCHLGFTQEKASQRGIQAPSFLGRNVRVLDSPTNIDYKPYLTQLYHLLFPKEIEAYLPQQPGARLLFVPHRKLSVIPILGLQDSSGHYLLEKYSAHQVPGIGVLLQTDAIQKARGTRNKSKSADMLLFGNPAMPKWGNGFLSPLAGAENEVKAISKRLQAPYQIGLTASEAAFKTQATDKRLIHLATHGISFDASPLESFIALAPGNGEDGQLTAAEILEMKFNADLVVLSACETGLGKISGDGVEGLLRSFMASGVPAVLVSLWKVDDEATRELMLAFYDNLNKGLDEAEALRQAQLKIMAIPKWRHPKFWAAFVLYGER